ncbi:CGNR zinc finger domain-containing protein [Sphaerisporangium dianthi]|uniref:CGNR zinc finger domain-containing protein n=1 Tax=Sphaerisporangium dianthi TaxID=1436120 RepID=A0ABV9CRD1_9ACTN
MERFAAVDLANTIRHDGDGGVMDLLATVAGTATWIGERDDLPAGVVRAGDDADGAAGAGLAGGVADEDLRGELVELRGAVRALFARAVSPGPPSAADARRLIPAGQALAHLNAVAAREPTVPQLHWPAGGPAEVRPLSAETDPRVRLLAALARAAVDFLSGPERERLRACTAPRCVRYFVKSHGRQEWCGPSCGNRARAARHYQRRHTGAEPPRP